MSISPKDTNQMNANEIRLIQDLGLHRLGEKTVSVRRYSVRQGLAWMIAADLVRRHPGRLRVVETHPHMYDQVSVFARDETEDGGWALIVHLNKELDGHLTHQSWFGEAGQERLTWLEVLLAENPRTEIVEPIERIEGLATPTTSPPTTSWSVGPRMLAGFAQRTMFGPLPWLLLNGMADSDYGANPREWLFNQFPALEKSRSVSRSDDFGRIPEWRYWFIVEGEDSTHENARALLAVDTIAGLAYSKTEAIELMPRYEASGRRIDALVSSICPPAF